MTNSEQGSRVELVDTTYTITPSEQAGKLLKISFTLSTDTFHMTRVVAEKLVLRLQQALDYYD